MQQQLEITVTFRDKATAQTQKLARETNKLTTAYTQVEKSSKLAAVAQTAMNRNVQQSTRGTASMTMALQSMNFTIRDSPYFFRDFSLGVLAVGNNLNPMIDSIIRVKQEMGGWKGAMKAFTAQMMGPAGVIMAFSLIVTGLQAITFAMAKSKSATKDLKDAFSGLTEFDSISQQKVFKFNYDSTKSAIEAIDLAVKDLKGSRMAAAKENLFMGDPVMQAREDMANAIANNEKINFSISERIQHYKDLKEVNAQIIEDKNKEIKKEEELVEKFREKKKEYEAELEYYDRLLKYADAVDRKDPKKKKEERFIQTEAEILLEIQKLTLLRDQSKSVYDRLQYAKEIYGLEYKLTEISRLPKFDELNYQAGQFTGRKGKLEGVDKIKKAKPELGDVNGELQTTDMLATRVGTSLYQAFLQGKLSLDELALSLAAVAAQLVIIEGLKYIFSGGISGLFGSFSQGGIVHASGGYMTGGNGSHDYIPAMLRPREMVLNPNQQQELFNMTKGMNGNVRRDGDVVVVLQGTLDGQQFLKKTIKKNNALLR